MAKASLITLSVTLFLMSCGDNDKSSLSEGNSDNADGVGVNFFDPKSAPNLASADLNSVMRNITNLLVPNFSDYATTGGQGTSLQLNELTATANLVGLQLDDKLSKCIDSAPATTDRFTASGSSLKQEVFTDWSQCFSQDLAEAGVSLTVAKCSISYMVEIDCPGSDFSAANGKTAKEALPILNKGMTNCKMAAGVQGSITGRMSSPCVLIGTKGDSTVSMNLQQKLGFMGSDGTACKFETVGNENVFKDCIDGSFRKLVSLVNEKERNEHYVSRVSLVNAKHRIGTESFVSGQKFDFAVNNWFGSVTTAGYSTDYTLSNGSETKSGKIY